MKLVITLLLAVLTVLSVEAHPHPYPHPRPHPEQPVVYPNPPQQPPQYPYYIPPAPRQPTPRNPRMRGMFGLRSAYFKQFMALFRQFLISQQNPTVPTPEPNGTATTSMGTCDLGEYVCVPVSLCEHVSEIQSFTCTNPQHVCCDN